MSRVGNNPISVPDNVSIKIDGGANMETKLYFY